MKRSGVSMNYPEVGVHSVMQQQSRRPMMNESDGSAIYEAGEAEKRPILNEMRKLGQNINELDELLSRLSAVIDPICTSPRDITAEKAAPFPQPTANISNFASTMWGFNNSLRDSLNRITDIIDRVEL